MAADAEVLFAEHHQQLFRYLCRAAGQSEAARDLTQDVFLRISRTAVPTASSAEVQAWLFRIARNLVIDYHRRRQRTPPVVALGEAGQRPASQDVTVAVNEALGALSDLDRDVFLLREVAGLGYDEIAKACDLTPDAVRSRIHRTRLRLRTDLAAPIATHRTSTMTQSGRRP
jgi:RNA polymerase sigma-70 factor (ECF subfamily)